MSDLDVRSIGVAPAGGPNVEVDLRATFTGDAGGTSYIQGWTHTLTSSGSNAIADSISGRFIASHTGGNITGALRAQSNSVTHAGTGTVTRIMGVANRNGVTSTGNVTTEDNFVALIPSRTSSGTTTKARGFVVEDLGVANINTILGLNVEDQSNATIARGVHLALSSGTGKHNVYADGTAPNWFRGESAFGALVDLSTSTAGQIKFPVTQNPSSNVNTFDDCERGSWTPAVIGSTTAGTQTYSVQSGRYIKHGKLVKVNFTIVMTAKDGATAGDIRISGLPFTVANDGVDYASCFSAYNAVTMNANFTQLTCRATQNTNYISLLQNGSAQTSTFITDTGIASTTRFIGEATYQAAA